MAELENETLKAALTARHGDQVLEVQKEACKKRTKKSLPEVGTQVLKEWWGANFEWPYPTVRSQRCLLSAPCCGGAARVPTYGAAAELCMAAQDKQKTSLAQRSGLDVVQVNNWFINMRKRVWHKLFPRGLPKTKAEAAAALAVAYGSRMA